MFWKKKTESDIYHKIRKIASNEGYNLNLLLVSNMHLTDMLYLARTCLSRMQTEKNIKGFYYKARNGKFVKIL